MESIGEMTMGRNREKPSCKKKQWYRHVALVLHNNGYEEDARLVLQLEKVYKRKIEDDLFEMPYTESDFGIEDIPIEILYKSLCADFSSLLKEYNSLLKEYNSLLKEYNSLLKEYNSLKDKYRALEMKKRGKKVNKQLGREIERLNDEIQHLQWEIVSLKSEPKEKAQQKTTTKPWYKNIFKRD